MAKYDAMDDLLSIESTTIFERSLIGALIEDVTLIDSITGEVDMSNFLNSSSRILYKTILDMSMASVPVDFISLLDSLDRSGQLKEVGGIPVVMEIRLAAGAPENVVNYAQIIKKRSMARDLSSAGQKIIEMGKSGGNVEESLVEAQDAILKISHGLGSKDFFHIKELLIDATDAIDNRIEGGSGGILTGFDDLDAKLNGLKGGDLIVVAGRPSMGKTVLGMQIANHVSMGVIPTSAAVFSLEMSKEQLVDRCIAQIGGVDFGRMTTGALTEEDFEGISVACGKLNEANLYINDMAALTHQQIYSKARSLARELKDTTAPLGLIVVDYLQIMGYQGDSHSRNDQVGEISRALKRLAKDLNIPVVVLAQINRGVETRTDKRPLMSDLRESGAVEQDADVIIMMYRDDYYNPDSEYKGMAEAIIRKARNGTLGTIGLAFEGHYVRFKNAYGAWNGQQSD